MRLSYSILLALAIVCFVSLEGVSAGTGRRLKFIVGKGKKHDPVVKILHKIVVHDGWQPAHFKKPVLKIDPWDLKKYYFDGKYYYFLYEDSIGKFFFKDFTKFYVFLFEKKVIVPSKKHHKPDPKVIIKVDDDKKDPKFDFKIIDDDKKDPKFDFKIIDDDKKDPKFDFKIYDDDKKDPVKDDKFDFGGLNVQASSDATAEAFSSGGGSATADTISSSDVSIGSGGISASSGASGFAQAEGGTYSSASSTSSSDASITLG